MVLLKKSTALAILRIGVVLCLGLFILGSIAVGILQGTFTGQDVNSIEAKAGRAKLTQESFKSHMPVYLKGEWEYYKNVFQVGPQFNYELLEGQQPGMVKMPITNQEKSVGPATYRLLLDTEMSISDFAFYIENYNEDFAIYVNGSRVISTWGGPQEKILYTLSDYKYRIDGQVDAGVTEILISANSSEDQALLYQNGILFGSSDAVTDYVARTWRDDTFLIGMILVMVMVGLVFMLIRTKLDMLAGITLFDTCLSIRILLGYNIASYFIHQLLPFMKIGNVDFIGMQYVMLFITGTFGCLLSQSLFDSEKKLPVWPIKVQICVCIVGSLLTLFFFGKIPMICIVLLFLLLLLSFLIVSWHVFVLIKRKGVTPYYVFQIIKTYYVGFVMAIDILFLRGESYNVLIYAYVVFLFAHLLARLIDSNSSYEEVESLNHNLERMIEERTGELLEANQRLSELSIRDPLTQVHNRLYFEDTLQRILKEKTRESLYLCMFDLDYFKRINDRFGHGAGDEQLKFVVNLVNEILEGKDVFARVGGEEFVILFTNRTHDNIMDILTSIRTKLESDAKENEMHTTASFGLVKCKDNFTLKEFLQASDKCLYAAKKMGRNCIVSK